MKFAASLIAATMVALASAKVAFTNSDFKIEEGKPFKLEWQGNAGPVDIVLVAGPDSGHLQPVKTVQTGLSGESFTYTPSDLPSGTYAFRITDTTDPGNPNFSVPFQYVGTGSLSTSGVSSITSARSTTSAATSSSSSAFSAPTTSATSSTSSTRSTSSTSTPTATSRPNNSNDSNKYKSPLALVFLTVAALAYFS